MSHPSRLDLFKAWAKAMEAGATVDKPNYGKTQAGPKTTQRRPRGTRRRRSTHPRRMRQRKMRR